MFTTDRKQAIDSYQEFMEIEKADIADKRDYDLSREFGEIETEINKMVFNKKV